MMKHERYIKPSFCVIGMEGSTLDGEGFIGRLWEKANARFDEVEHLALRNEDGSFVGFWGLMSDMSHSFLPWEDHFSKGLYLAGVECSMDAQPPEGWSRWVVPGYEYIRVSNDEADFQQALAYLDSHGLSLAGAVHDFICPQTGKGEQFFPISKH